MTARALIAAGLALGVLSYVFVLTPIDIGIWPRVEPMLIAVHLAAAIAAAGLAVGIWVGDARAARAVRHPLVLIAAFVAVWSALVAPFADFPWMSLVGTAQSGEGTLMKADFAVFLAAGLALRGDRRAFDRVAALAVAVSWLAAALVFVVPRTRIFGIEDYLAFYSFPVAALVACRLGGWKGAALGVAAALPTVAVSTNMAAVVALPALAVPAYLLAVWQKRRARPIGAVIATAIPFVALAAVMIIGSRDWIPSIRSRELIMEVVGRDLSTHPLALVVGNGWGYPAELFFQYLTATRAAIWDESWDVVFRAHFHTLNYAVEPLVSAGLPAALAAVALFAAIPLFAPRRRVAVAVAFVAAHGFVAALWFEMPMTVPVVALAISSLVAPTRSRAPRTAVPVLAVLILAQIGTAAMLLDWGLDMRRALARETACADWPAEAWRGDIGLRAAFLDLTKSAIERHGRGETIAPATLAQIDSLRCAVDARAAVTRSARLASAPVLFRNDITRTPGFAALYPGFGAALADWPARLRMVLALAPRRADLALPYLAERVKQGDYTQVEAFAGSILARAPRDPVGLWFLGIALLESPDPGRQRAGLARLREGLDAGIERILPIQPELKARISAVSAGAQ